MYKTPTTIKSIEILGVTVRIEIDQYRLEVEDEADGMYTNKVIYLKKQYDDKKHYDRVLFHEAIHALCSIQGYQLDDRFEESLANTISYLGVKLL